MRHVVTRNTVHWLSLTMISLTYKHHLHPNKPPLKFTYPLAIRPSSGHLCTTNNRVLVSKKPEYTHHHSSLFWINWFKVTRILDLQLNQYSLGLLYQQLPFLLTDRASTQALLITATISKCWFSSCLQTNAKPPANARAPNSIRGKYACGFFIMRIPHWQST